MLRKQGSAPVFFVVALALFLGVFWFLGKEAYKTDALQFSILPKESRGQSAVVNLSIESLRTEETSRVTETIASQYLSPLALNSLAQNDGSFSDEALIEDIYNALDDVLPKEIPFVKTEDLHIVPTSDASLEKYVQEVLAIEKDLITEDVGQEVRLFTEKALTTSEKERGEAITRIRNSAHIYEEMSSRLSRMNVPELVAEEHKDIINTLLYLSYGSTYLAEGLLDPILSLIGIQLYEQGVVLHFEVQEKIQKKLQ